MRLKIFLTSIATLAVGAAWFHERLESIRLEAELDLARETQRELRSLQTEHERLVAKEPAPARVDELRRAATERDRLRAELDARRAAMVPPFSLSEWVPSQLWENHGNATPSNAVETALWAAAGGDTYVLQSMLELDAEAMKKSSTLLSALPPELRGAFSSPQALIATVTTKNIPLGKAQVTWLHEFDQDHAVVGLVMAHPDGTPNAKPPTGAGVPPMLPDDGKFKVVTLSLHRTDSGWHLVVPARAIDRIAQDLLASRK